MHWLERACQAQLAAIGLQRRIEHADPKTIALTSDAISPASAATSRASKAAMLRDARPARPYLFATSASPAKGSAATHCGDRRTSIPSGLPRSRSDSKTFGKSAPRHEPVLERPEEVVPVDRDHAPCANRAHDLLPVRGLVRRVAHAEPTRAEINDVRRAALQRPGTNPALPCTRIRRPSCSISSE
jgi:hypothetical protein